MAMNKREQAEMDALRKELLMLKSWKLTEPVKPDVPVPGWGEGLVAGFSFNAYSKRVEPSCSTDISHSRSSSVRANTQKPIEQFSTRERAFRAMRYEMEREFLKALADVDAQIAEEVEATAR